MGGSDNWISNGVRSVALVGRSGNGKSATGNSILGEKVFKSMCKPTGVTTTSELQTRVLQDGQILHVIDTPGLFESSSEPEFVGKEVVKCIHMAEGGLHAILVVFNLRNRFTDEEESVLLNLKKILGDKIYDYMIVVFTNGDVLEENDMTLEQYLACDGGSQPLQEILQLCSNRVALFDNKTSDETKKSKQVDHLLQMVNRVVDLNGGRSFTDVIFEEMQRFNELSDPNEKETSLGGMLSKEETSKLVEQTLNSYQERIIERLVEMLDAKIKSLERQLGEDKTKFQNQIESLEKQLEEEKAAREKAQNEKAQNEKRCIIL